MNGRMNATSACGALLPARSLSAVSVPDNQQETKRKAQKQKQSRAAACVRGPWVFSVFVHRFLGLRFRFVCCRLSDIYCLVSCRKAPPAASDFLGSPRSALVNEHRAKYPLNRKRTRAPCASSSLQRKRRAATPHGSQTNSYYQSYEIMNCLSMAPGRKRRRRRRSAPATGAGAHASATRGGTGWSPRGAWTGVASTRSC
jgi:hypothetical protein